MKNFLKQLLGQSNANRKVMAIEELATKRGTTGGLVKRIDENRELLELLQERVPQFVSSHPWLVGWIQANDNFFTQLEGILETHQALRMPKDYPRPWPVSKSYSELPSEEFKLKNSVVNLQNESLEPQSANYIFLYVVFAAILSHLATMLAFVPGFIEEMRNLAPFF